MISRYTRPSQRATKKTVVSGKDVLDQISKRSRAGIARNPSIKIMPKVRRVGGAATITGDLSAPGAYAARVVGNSAKYTGADVIGETKKLAYPLRRTKKAWYGKGYVRPYKPPIVIRGKRG